jgi:two-component system sensor histidine kinase HydH
MTLLPKSAIPFKFSRIALSIVIAATLLALLLTTVTLRNINKEQRLMETFLYHEGLALIRSFEAGARTSMMHFRQGIDPLTTLVEETVKEEAVVYIKVVNENGRVLAEGGDVPETDLRPPVDKILAEKEPVTLLLAKEKVFEIASPFKPLEENVDFTNRMMGRWQQRMGEQAAAVADRRSGVIYLGLSTDKFDRSRQEDLRNALLLGGILFLAGSAGFYLLFVYQGMRVARSTLADMELYTKNVIESMPAGLITLDNEGRVVSCNKKAEDITGASFALLNGKKLDQEIPQCPPFSSEKDLLLDEPFAFTHIDGTTIPVKMSSSRLTSSDGKATGLVLIIRDVREILDMEQKLERIRRLAALGRMAAGIAHEIRNPLGTLKGFAQYFKNKFTPNTTEWEYTDLMIDEVDRLNRSISALLQFSRPREPEFSTLCLNDILAKTEKLLHDDFTSKNISFSLGLQDSKIMMEADSDLLLQLFLNLLHNSIAACSDGGEISINAERKSESVHVHVKDSGAGMNPDEISRMFDPFFTTKKTGTGLGLAVVHQIINQHKGTIEVQSEEHQGTEISITLPLTRERNRMDK